MLVQMRSINRQPRTIIDIKRLVETNRLEVDAEQIYIGSAVPSAKMQEHAAKSHNRAALQLNFVRYA